MFRLCAVLVLLVLVLSLSCSRPGLFRPVPSRPCQVIVHVPYLFCLCPVVSLSCPCPVPVPSLSRPVTCCSRIACSLSGSVHTPEPVSHVFSLTMLYLRGLTFFTVAGASLQFFFGSVNLNIFLVHGFAVHLRAAPGPRYRSPHCTLGGPVPLGRGAAGSTCSSRPSFFVGAAAIICLYKYICR